MKAEIFEQFRAALEARDIIPPEPLIADGQIHRCDVAGKRGKNDVSYLLHLDGFPARSLEIWAMAEDGSRGDWTSGDR